MGEIHDNDCTYSRDRKVIDARLNHLEKGLADMFEHRNMTTKVFAEIPFIKDTLLWVKGKLDNGLIAKVQENSLRLACVDKFDEKLTVFTTTLNKIDKEVDGVKADLENMRTEQKALAKGGKNARIWILFAVSVVVSVVALLEATGAI